MGSVRIGGRPRVPPGPRCGVGGDAALIQQLEEPCRKGVRDLKILSWNVNGLRSCLQKGFADVVAAEAPDVFCLQETRALPEQVGLDLPGYGAWWFPAAKKGYSGTAILSRHEPLDVRRGLGDPEFDAEGRVLALEYPEWFVLSVYSPNAQHDLARLALRQRFDVALLDRMRELEREKPVVVCGDLNVSHQPIDLARPRENVKNAGFTPEERAGFQRFVDAGFVDTFRVFESGGGHYSWWSWRLNARERNVGWRIDYVLVSGVLRPRLVSAGILSAIHGSDHCPVEAVLS